MKKVIRLDEPKEESKKPIELTHWMNPKMGWDSDNIINGREVIYYLGRCSDEGDIFMLKDDGQIHIYKGHLNDGVY